MASLRTYFWLWTQLIPVENYIHCQVSNQALSHARQVSYPLYNLSRPNCIYFYYLYNNIHGIYTIFSAFQRCIWFYKYSTILIKYFLPSYWCKFMLHCKVSLNLWCVHSWSFITDRKSGLFVVSSSYKILITWGIGWLPLGIRTCFAVELF